MPTIARAKHILRMMGGNRSIYWDHRNWCYRVIASNSPSLLLPYIFPVTQT